ncbi:MAG: hypothetical protein LBJ12_08535 [Oscillospiraceae bacterium]|nr:hypothetical protein [Oscillospiraceae bacterium]
MKIQLFFRNTVLCVLLVALLAFAACTHPVPTVGIEIPQPDYLQDSNNLGTPSSFVTIEPPSDSAVDPTPSNSITGINPNTVLSQSQGYVTNPPPTRGDVSTTPNQVTNPPLISITTPQSTTPTAPRQKLPMPQSNAAIAAFYNEATRKVNASRAGFRKSNTTKVLSINGLEKVESLPIIGKALSKEIRKKITEFLGEGTSVNTATKGNASNYLVSASLQSGDLTSVSCRESGDKYIIYMQIKSVTNPTRDAGNALGRFTVDFRTQAEARATLEAGLMNVKPKVGTVTIVSKNSQITAEIDKYTGNPINVHMQYAFDVEILDVHGGALGVNVDVDKASGSGSSDILFTNFVF